MIALLFLTFFIPILRLIIGRIIKIYVESKKSANKDEKLEARQMSGKVQIAQTSLPLLN